MADNFLINILTAFSLVFVIEGFLYAAFPDVVRKLMAMAIMLPVDRLRYFGLGMMALGVLSVFFCQLF